MKRVLVVGAGCTGACAAVQLRWALGNTVSIDVWEKARGAGGRMTTTREEVRGETVRADVGAQYLSVDMNDPVSKALTEILLKSGTVAEIDQALLSTTPERERGGSWKHFAGVDGGVNSALKVLIEEARANPHYERRVASIDKQGEKWKVRPFDGATELFDAVVVAIPGCGWGNDNLNKIHGGWEGMITSECSQRLQAPQHDHRFALVLFLDPEYKEYCEKFFGPALEKLIDDDMVHLVAYQTRKTAMAGGPTTVGPAIVVHTTHDYSRKNRNAGGRDRWFLEAVADRVLHQYLMLPANVRVNRALVGSKVITWKQCQVTKSIAGAHGLKCQPVGNGPPLVLAGDYFTQSNFSGCAASASDAAQAIACLFEGKPVNSLKSTTVARKTVEHIARTKDEGKMVAGGGEDASLNDVNETNNDSKGASDAQKERMKLKKKLREIEKLEAQEAPLKPNQLEKIKLKSGLLAQLEALGPEETVAPSVTSIEETKSRPGALDGAEEGKKKGKGKGIGGGDGYPNEGTAKKSKGSGKSKGKNYAFEPYAAA